MDPEVNVGDIIEFFSPDDNAWLTGEIIHIQEKHNPGARTAKETWVKIVYLEIPGLWEKKMYATRLDQLKHFLVYGAAIQY